MSDIRVRPKRHLRHEFYSLLAVLVLPAVIMAVFPFEALGFRATAPQNAQSSGNAACAFVRLTAREEQVALVASRSSWRVGSAEIRGMRAELAGGKLPDDPLPPVEPLRKRRVGSAAVVPYGARLLPRSLAAPAPQVLKAEAAAKDGPFPRSELLKIK